MHMHLSSSSFLKFHCPFGLSLRQWVCLGSMYQFKGAVGLRRGATRIGVLREVFLDKYDLLCTKEQQLSKRGTTSTSIAWKRVTNANSWHHLRPTESETLGVGPAICGSTSPAGDTNAC